MAKHRITLSRIWTVPTGRCSWSLSSLIVLAAMISLPAAAQTSYQQIDHDREYAVKAAFLYHFLTYMEWPEGAFQSADQPFVIGVLASDPFGGALDKVAQSKTVAGRPIEIRRLQSLDGVHACHILFVPSSVPKSTQDAAIQAVRGIHVLTVGETEDFVDRGGAAHFYVDGDKVRFAFSSDVVEGKHFKISSKLLSLAKIVSTH